MRFSDSCSYLVTDCKICSLLHSEVSRLRLEEFRCNSTDLQCVGRLCPRGYDWLGDTEVGPSRTAVTIYPLCRAASCEPAGSAASGTSSVTIARSSTAAATMPPSR